MLATPGRSYSSSRVQAHCRGASMKSSRHMCVHATVRLTVLTVLLQDPDDCFVHMLLQFCTLKAEVALEGDKIMSLLERPCDIKKALTGLRLINSTQQMKTGRLEGCCTDWATATPTGQNGNNSFSEIVEKMQVVPCAGRCHMCNP